MADLDALRGVLRRLEAAEGPDREVDHEIALTLFVPHVDGRIFPVWAHAGGLKPSDKWACIRFDQGGNPEPVPAYTASLDASLALMKRHGFGWQVDGVEGCTLSDADDCYDVAKGATPPLSVCVGLIRALITRTETEATHADP